MSNKMRMDRVITTGNAKQDSDTDGTDMAMKRVRGKSAVQRIATQLQTIEIFGWKGAGIWAIGAIVVVALATIAVRAIW